VADILDAIKSAGAPEQGVDIRAAIASAGEETPPPAPVAPATTLDRFRQGFADTAVGANRLMYHLLPDPVNKALSKVDRWVGNESPSSVAEVDKIVTQREQQYQQARAQAGQDGIDWWRIGGGAANPANWFGGTGKVAASVVGRIGQAAIQGGVMGALQSSAESTAPNGYTGDVLKGATMGAMAGGVVGGAVEAVSAGLSAGLSKLRGMFKAGTPPPPNAADAVVKAAMSQHGVDPGTVDMKLVRGMREEVQSAIEHGTDVSPVAIANRARAESLPVPIRLTRGQATGDAMQFAKEQNLRGIAGAGEPITARLTEQNQAAIQNLDLLGAKDAPTVVDTGVNYAGRIQAMWDGLQQRKDQLYAAVRNSAGQSAAMDGTAAAKNIKAALDNPQASHVYDMLPANIKKTLDSLEAGDFPLTVAQAQSLDKQWYLATKGADGSTANAINQARSMVLDAPIADDIGQEAKQAYLMARQAHAQQMSLLDAKLPNGMPNPNFQPLVKAVVQDGQPPEKLFDQGFLKVAPSVAKKNLTFLSQIDPDAPKQIGQTLMGEIKRQALNSASAERGTVSQNVLTQWANNPVQSARLDALMPTQAAATFRNLAATVETAKRFPVASAVNTSNTGSAVVNASVSMVKNSALAQVAKRLPVVNGIAEGVGAAQLQTDVAAALNPGVSLKSIMTATPAQAARNTVARRVIVPAVAAGQAAGQSSEGAQD
jgi:hypothetical protein